MGLDMYLERMPRFRGCTAKQINAVNSYFDWKEAKAEGSKYANCTLEKWCGTSYKDIPKDAIKFYKPFYITRYYSWDDKHEYGHKNIIEQVGYWRKANAIHKWFVDNIQDGEDDCGYYEVAPEYLEDCEDIAGMNADEILANEKLIEDIADEVIDIRIGYESGDDIWNATEKNIWRNKL